MKVFVSDKGYDVDDGENTNRTDVLEKINSHREAHWKNEDD